MNIWTIASHFLFVASGVECDDGAGNGKDTCRERAFQKSFEGPHMWLHSSVGHGHMLTALVLQRTRNFEK